MNHENRLVSVEQSIEEGRTALYCIANSLAIDADHIPTADDVQRQYYEAAQVTDHAQKHLAKVEDTFRAMRENGFDVAFDRATTLQKSEHEHTCEHQRVKVKESRILDEPITAQFVGRLAIVGEQISQRRYGRRVTALVVSALEGVPLEGRMDLIDSNGTILEPSVSPYQRRRRPEEVPMLKRRLASFKV